MEQEKEIKLVRFVDLNGAKKVIHPNSTFVLRSLQYYRDLEEIDGDIERGDMKEANHRCSDGGGQEFYAQSVIISCWSVFDEHNMSKYWSLFGDSVLAIISTNNKVKNVLQKICQEILGKDGIIKGDKVKYYEQSIKRLDEMNMDKIPFYKENRQKKIGFFRCDEQQYRFAIYSCHGIETLISYVNPYDYIDNILINLDLGDSVGQRRIWEAIIQQIGRAKAAYGYGSEFKWFEKISNFDEMGKRFEQC